MGSEVKEISEEVVQYLAGLTFFPAFSPTRAYQAITDLKDFDQLKVTVIPRAIEFVNESRASDRGDYTILIGVQKKIAPKTQTEEVDQLVDLVEDIIDQIRYVCFDLPSKRVAQWMSIQNDPIFDGSMLQEKHLFTSLIVIVYRVFRKKKAPPP